MSEWDLSSDVCSSDLLSSRNMQRLFQEIMFYYYYLDYCYYWKGRIVSTTVLCKLVQRPVERQKARNSTFRVAFLIHVPTLLVKENRVWHISIWGRDIQWQPIVNWCTVIKTRMWVTARGVSEALVKQDVISHRWMYFYRKLTEAESISRWLLLYVRFQPTSFLFC